MSEQDTITPRAAGGSPTTAPGGISGSTSRHFASGSTRGAVRVTEPRCT
jgi:hypothetical protein